MADKIPSHALGFSGPKNFHGQWHSSLWDQRPSLRCMLFLLFTLVPDEPRDYDELAEDEDANPGGTSSLDVNMEDAHAILNEEDTEPGNPSSPPAPHSRQGGKSEFPRILHATISSINSTQSGVALRPPHHSRSCSTSSSTATSRVTSSSLPALYFSI